MRTTVSVPVPSRRPAPWAALLAALVALLLLAPAGASLDMFPSYGARGEAFARAVHQHAGG